MANECKPLFRPGRDVTVLATAAVTGSTFVNISASRDAATGLIKVAPATAAGAAFGVATADIASGGVGAVIKGGIVPVTAGGAIAAGAQVEIAAGGKVVTLASGIAVGQAVEAGTNNNPVFVNLYQ
ncbi:capsid cement protein [Nocardia australiensis]|uniref:capsid cement protein n=1 Tax=Nocardia australiensis TaxID=2887191 RepID=UPI001D14EDC4|nr:capsid cement protein [Nocardia australiensis]